MTHDPSIDRYAAVLAQAVTEHVGLDTPDLPRALTYALNLCEELDWDAIGGDAQLVETLRRSLQRLLERLPE